MEVPVEERIEETKLEKAEEKIEEIKIVEEEKEGETDKQGKEEEEAAKGEETKELIISTETPAETEIKIEEPGEEDKTVEKEGEISIETEGEASSEGGEGKETKESEESGKYGEEETIDLESVEQEGSGGKAATSEEESGLSDVEKTIKEKFGDVGIKVYNLIDGSRTTDEIMKETGVSDKKLVEILNFLEDKGIIKMEGKDKAQVEEKPIQENIGEVLGPDEYGMGQDPKGFPTIDTPIKLGTDIIKMLKVKADLLLKYGDRGSKIMDMIDGKNDVLDLSLKLNLAFYEVWEVLNFLIQNAAIMMKPLTRLEVKKKYGDPGFAVYKRFGREGVMLYELIDKNLSIKQMAGMITKDKEKFLDMFLFIRKVLNIEIPIDKEVLMKQLG